MPAADHPRKVKTLAFDLGNVLIRVDQRHFCRQIATYTQVSPDEILTLVFDGPSKSKFDTGRLTSQEFYQQITTGLQSSLAFEQFCRFWTGIFSPWAGMEAVVANLQPLYRLLLVSNTDPLHFEHARSHFPVLRLFNHYLLSYELGCQKPDPDIYQALIGALGHPPEQCLFIDDLLANVEAARRQGLQAWQFLSCEGLQQRLTRQGLW